MKVLSLFDGISCARVALERVGLKVDAYYASEIDANAIKVSTKNYPDIQHIGDVKSVQKVDDVDLLIAGSPCQDLSISKKGRLGLKGERSGLFWEWVRVWKAVKPKWWVLENVASMPRGDRDTITAELGVEPVMFDASLVSAQSRKRLFWTNIPFELPADRNIQLKDILQPPAQVDERMIMKNKSFTLTSSYAKVSASPAQIEYSVKRKQRTMVKVGYFGTDAQANRIYDPDGKSATLSANGGGMGAKTGLYRVGTPAGDVGEAGERVGPEVKNTLVRIRKLTPVECERLQSLPDNYTEGIAMTNRYKVLGNAFNVQVIAHILGSLAPPTPSHTP